MALLSVEVKCDRLHHLSPGFTAICIVCLVSPQKGRRSGKAAPLTVWHSHPAQPEAPLLCPLPAGRCTQHFSSSSLCFLHKRAQSHCSGPPALKYHESGSFPFCLLFQHHHWPEKPCSKPEFVANTLN